MTFCYFSGAATDSTEQGKVMWARVKGKTENDLMKLPFKKVYALRPGYMQPASGLKNTLKMYAFLRWSYLILRKALPGHVSTLKEVGIAMIHCAKKDYGKSVLDFTKVIQINSLKKVLQN